MLILLACFIHLLNAQHLDVEGHSLILGNLDLSHMNDGTTINIGPNAGINTDFTINRNNTFVGSNTGLLNTSGHNNSFFGSFAGVLSCTH